MKRILRTKAHRSTGFTLIEAVISMMLVSGLMVAALRAASGTARLSSSNSNRATARLLADGLIAEILPLDYKASGSTTLGTDGGETSSSKVAYQDVDDFNNWVETPPQNADGSVMAGMAGWSRKVTVQWVTLNNPAVVSSSDTGVKRITITVSKANVPILYRVALRTAAP